MKRPALTTLAACAALLALSSARAGDNVGDTAVLPVKDGKKAAFLIQFDDAHMSQLPVVVPALRDRGLVGTFYFFDRKEHVHDRRDQWIAAGKTGAVVFGNHTKTHGNIQDSYPDKETARAELEYMNNVIRELTPDLPWPRLIAYASAGGKTPENKGIGFKGTDEVLAELNLVRRPQFWGAGIHVKNAAAMMKIVDRAVENGGMGHLDFHGVGKTTSGINASRDDFLAFLDHVEENKKDLWVTDCASWIKYETEKKTAKAAAAVDGAKVTVTLTSDAGPLYDQPLTLETRVPDGWTQAKATQGKRDAVTVEVKNNVVRYDAVPNAEPVVLERAG